MPISPPPSSDDKLRLLAAFLAENDISPKMARIMTEILKVETLLEKCFLHHAYLLNAQAPNLRGCPGELLRKKHIKRVPVGNFKAPLPGAVKVALSSTALYRRAVCVRSSSRSSSSLACTDMIPPEVINNAVN